MKFLKYFESIDSDKRAFTKWERGLSNPEHHQHDNALFQWFLKQKPKLDNRDIFSYQNKLDLERELQKVSSRTNIVRKFEKDVTLWKQLNLNCDILHESDEFIILHPKDFESEYKLSSGCHICTTQQRFYDRYLEMGCYFFDILDMKENKKYYGTYGTSNPFNYEIVNSQDSFIMRKDLHYGNINPNLWDSIVDLSGLKSKKRSWVEKKSYKKADSMTPDRMDSLTKIIENKVITQKVIDVRMKKEMEKNEVPQ